ncbi:MAG: hypothetical protein K2R98_17570 [Gemmataceae bacterium]|nr:hypothetical protein [Gemmataceae bacterium]
MHTISESPWRLFSHSILGLFSARVREATPTEVDLQAEVDRLRAMLAAREEAAVLLQRDMEQLKATAEVQKLEIALLTDVNSRDRLRVQAEQTGYASHINAAITPRA